MESISNIQSQIEEGIKAKGFERYGFAQLEKPMTIGFYKTWLNDNFNGDMKYLENHFEMKLHPQQLLSKVQSAIVVTKNYFPHPHAAPYPLEASRVALYAKGQDYHHWFLKELEELCSHYKEQFPEHEFLAMTDSKPVLERELGYKAGLGWVGKNTCLIDSKAGSLFFIGEIYTTLSLNHTEVLHPDRCGTCTRCIDICPTQAIVEDKRLDARKCISYLTIESKSIPDENIRSSMGDWLFGCDLCQTVCPWNEKAFGPDMKSLSLPKSDSSSETLSEELSMILNSSNRYLKKYFHGTALDRATPNGLKRNALLVIGNLQLVELKSAVEAYLDHKHLNKLAQWAISQLNSRPSSP